MIFFPWDFSRSLISSISQHNFAVCVAFVASLYYHWLLFWLFSFSLINFHCGMESRCGYFEFMIWLRYVCLSYTQTFGCCCVRFGSAWLDFKCVAKVMRQKHLSKWICISLNWIMNNNIEIYIVHRVKWMPSSRRYGNWNW